MLKKEQSFYVTTNDLNTYRHLLGTSLLNFCQTVAIEHADEIGIGYDKLAAINQRWLSIGNRFTFLKKVEHPEQLRIVTYPLKGGQFHCDRDFYIYEDDELIIKGSSKWVLFDTSKERICLTTSVLQGEELQEERVYEKTITKFDLGNKDDYKLVGTHKVNYLDLDYNHHFNNTKYFNLFYEAYPLSENEFIKELQIDYINQCYQNEDIDLFLKKDGKDILMICKTKEKVICNIKVTLF